LDIGDRIKEQRLNRSWTQEKLASSLNVSRSAVSGWEVGRNYPDLETIVLISDLFEISLDKLLREDTSMVKETSKRTKRFKFYQIALIILSLLVVSYIGYNQKLRHDEHTYRANLKSHGWLMDNNDGHSDGNAYTIEQEGINYWTYIMPTGWIGFPLTENKVNVIVRNKHLVVDIKDDKNFEAIISKNNDKNVTFSASVTIDKNANFLHSNETLSSNKKHKIKRYLLQYKDNYQQMIDRGTIKRAQIISKTK